MKKLIYILASFALLGCQNPKNEKNTLLSKKDICILKDSLYKFKNIKQTVFPEKTDNFIAMDSIQKNILFKQFLESDLKSISFGFEAYFVSKQEKISSLTPIIVEIRGTDFGSQWLMLLDSNLVTVSKIELGHHESGPEFVNDTTHTLWPDNINYFFHDTIKTISVIKTRRNKDVSLVMVDSMTYLRKILPTGKVITTKVDSLRYYKK